MLLHHLEECYLAVVIPSQSVQSRPSQITTGEVAKNSRGNSSEGDAVLQTKLYSSSCWFHQVIADAWRLDTCIFVVTEFLSIEKKEDKSLGIDQMCECCVTVASKRSDELL